MHQSDGGASARAKASDDRYVDDREAARVLGLSRSYMRALRITGRGPRFSTLSARAIRYRLADLHQWAESKAATSTSEREVAYV